ncbi:Protein CBG26583 [Caenorhabditis briggsae]|uniref:Protein CBG26583 n=1 Tax=Caenorhabditis briggsae TaxID=6238 RepID=B6IIE3_CAEBR|nr:Protein CBG26583 [Caenorhabditis briggsae]CAR99673.1 Protein CBG26583 [Caenorhabditis briggsae]
MFNLLVINFPVTVVVPCVNAIQFIATFIVGISMGEQMQQSTVKQRTGMVLAMIAILGMLVIE